MFDSPHVSRLAYDTVLSESTSDPTTYIMCSMRYRSPRFSIRIGSIGRPRFAKD